jgi:hypothetical protein
MGQALTMRGVKIAESADAATAELVEELVGMPAMGVLPWQLEHALLFGTGSGGGVIIRELIVWQREWSEWRDRILPKFIKAFPGRRPAAAYICGELPQRPLGFELPLSHRYRGERCVYVIDGDNGFTYCDLPEPYQRDEARHLHAAGVIDGDELRRYRGYVRRPGLRLYAWEVTI